VPARKSICMVVSSVELTAECFLAGHLAAMTHSYDVCLVANCRDRDYLRRLGISVDVLYAPIVRDISPLSDITALFALYVLFRKHRFDAIHSVSPKAGLLGVLAAWLARSSVRVHTFTGQVWATRVGLGRAVLKFLDKLLVACATHILVDSHSQLEFLLREGVVTIDKASVLGSGSISGVDTERFQPRPEVHDRIRKALKIPHEAFVFLFVGRLKKDKGVLDLATAFSSVCKSYANAYLAIVGADEEQLSPEIASRCGPCSDRLRIQGRKTTPEDYMASADILCLPSYREGFGSVVIEAAACEVPALASRIYGITDAIREGETGVFHRPGDVEDLTAVMLRMAQDKQQCIAMGKMARARVKTEFSIERVTADLLQYYEHQLFSQ
jgi:glycosyltransferase involved in cell wall biosynthesis